MGLICGRQTSCTLDCQPATYCCPVLHVGWMKYFITPNEDVPDARTGTSDRSSLHRPETARACVRYQDTFVWDGRYSGKARCSQYRRGQCWRSSGGCCNGASVHSIVCATKREQLFVVVCFNVVKLPPCAENTGYVRRSTSSNEKQRPIPSQCYESYEELQAKSSHSSLSQGESCPSCTCSATA